MVNISNLNNITPFEVNNSLINSTTEMIPNLYSNANQTTDGFFGLGIMVSLFIFLLLITMADQDVFRLPFSSALVFSSGMATLAGIILILSNLISSFQHVMWFAIIFAIALLVKFYERG